MFENTLCHSLRERRVETTMLSPWHGAHMRSTTAFPVPSGRDCGFWAASSIAQQGKPASSLVEATPAHKIDSKRTEPVRALVVLTRDAAEASLTQFVRERFKLGFAWITGG